MFFKDYPRFFETSETSALNNRLNLRYEAIFGQNRDLFADARVLDIASHDGRWSFAALKSGAKSVVGIEGRADLVEHATQNLKHYGYDSDRATFVAGDVFELLNEQVYEADVVLCLGFMYHTLRYNELMSGIRRANPRFVIVDTVADPMFNSRPAVWVHRERTSREGNAIVDRYTHGTNAVLSGRPNYLAMKIMMAAYGFRIDQQSDWKGLLRDNPELGGQGVTDYANEERITFRCVDVSRS